VTSVVGRDSRASQNPSTPPAIPVTNTYTTWNGDPLRTRACVEPPLMTLPLPLGCAGGPPLGGGACPGRLAPTLPSDALMPATKLETSKLEPPGRRGSSMSLGRIGFVSPQRSDAIAHSSAMPSLRKPVCLTDSSLLQRSRRTGSV
jgi:hypothetical protein